MMLVASNCLPQLLQVAPVSSYASAGRCLVLTYTHHTELAVSLRHLSALSTLGLHQSLHASPEEFTTLAQSLRQLSALQDLTLGNNSLGPGSRHAMFGTDIPRVAICLRASYAIPGTDIARAVIGLRISYAMPSTDRACCLRDVRYGRRPCRTC